MVLNYIWVAFFLIALIVGLFRLIFLHDTEIFTTMVNSTFEMAKVGFEISLGLTGETQETLNDTLRVALEIPYDYAQVSIATPFPGTRFHEKMKEQGAIRSEHWSDFDGTLSAVVAQNDLTPEYLESFKRRMIIRMMLRKLCSPRWVWRQIRWQSIVLRNQGIGELWGLVKYALRFFFVGGRVKG